MRGHRGRRAAAGDGERPRLGHRVPAAGLGCGQPYSETGEARGPETKPLGVPLWDPRRARPAPRTALFDGLHPSAPPAGPGTWCARSCDMSTPLSIPASPPAPRPGPSRYVPRTTQSTFLWKLLHDAVPTFLAEADSDEPEWRVPAFVRKQLQALLDCGDVASGYLIAACTSCHHPRVIPYS